MTYRKNDLRALAIALSLSDKGTNAELLSCIQNSFEQNPDLKQNLQFSGLFDRSTCERKSAASSNIETQDIGIVGTSTINWAQDVVGNLTHTTNLPPSEAPFFYSHPGPASHMMVSYNFNSTVHPYTHFNNPL